MRRYLTLAVLLAVLVAPLAGPAVPGTARAQSDVVTLTVTVETRAGDPVRNANVTATWADGSASTTTAANGQALVDVAAGADVTLEVTHPRFVRNTPVTVENASTQSVTVTVAPKASARVTVVDAAGPLENATVRLERDGTALRTLRTNASGIAVTGAVEAGEYSLVVSRPGYVPVNRTIELSGQATPRVRLSKAATLTVTVRDENVEPAERLADATVTVGARTATTNFNGTATLTVPANRSLDVTVRKPGYRNVTRTLTVANATREVAIAMGRTPALSVTLLNDRVVVGERVRVRVLDEYDTPVADATVLIDGDPAGTTDADGVALFELDAAGEHTIRVEGEERTSEPVTVEGVPATAAASDPGTETATPATDTPSTPAPPEGSFDAFDPLSIGVGVIAALLVVGIAVGLRAILARRNRPQY